ncbi:PREDICTED: odorant receptor 85b-like [Eufriesea mexicana]|uniref:odorant receptor 85b-like n=1 Tax=Eufriesea mexicana TaxID=516756 RepID=UPI00083BAF62|nr:PREDICTED: odorant receptor 85b-like [Eufriesea mexicana]
MEYDLRYATRFVKPMLGIIGVWPIPATSSFSSKVLQKIEIALTYFLSFVMITPPLMHMFLREKNPKIKLKLLGPLVNCGMQIGKYTILLWRMKEIRNALDTIREDWLNTTEENQLIYKEKAKFGRKVILIVTASVYGGGLCYRIILPLLKGTIVTAGNVTVRPLPISSYLVFIDEQKTPNYEILFVLQVIAGFVTYGIISGSCGISALFILHTCSMMMILMNKMKKLVNKTDTSEAVVQRKIADIVEYQIKIKKFLKNIETITEYIYLIEMVGGTCLICLVGYYILMEWENTNTTAIVTYIMLQISFISNVFIVCYIGQLLVDQNEIVGETACTVNWYHLSTKHVRCLILIIAMSNSPMKLMAGKMLDMSLTTFTDVVKVSMGYLNILRGVI